MPQEAIAHPAASISTDDILIAVIGSPGAGKTSFISTLTGRRTNQGRTLALDRGNVQTIVFQDPALEGKRIIFLDTPGFDHTTRSDSEIIKSLEDWLAQMRRYSGEVKLSGILYLTSITSISSPAILPSNLPRLQKLCNANSLHNFVFVTTMWNQLSQDTGGHNESQLIEKHWRKLILSGAQVARFQETSAEGWYVIEKIIGNGLPELLFQPEQRRTPPPVNAVIVPPPVIDPGEEKMEEQVVALTHEPEIRPPERSPAVNEQKKPKPKRNGWLGWLKKVFCGRG